MLRSLAIAFCAIGLGVLAGCGVSQRGHAEWRRGYMDVWRNAGGGVTFLQLHRHGHHLRGTVIGSVFVPDPRWPRGSYQRQDFTITGTISGSHVRLHYPNGLDATGTLSPSVLLVRSTRPVPAGHLPLPLMRMSRATLADYRAFVNETHG